MGPAHGTKEYDRQVHQIYTAISTSKVEKKELSSALMLYILDEGFSRGAICEAEKQLKEKHFD